MAKRKAPTEFIKSAEPKQEPTTFSGKLASSDLINTYQLTSARQNDFSDLSPGISGKPGMTRLDYEAFRPDEATPKSYRQLLERCNIAYNETGIIYNIINLMADFASKGITIVHKNKKIESFGKNWARIVQMDERSERFVNTLLRLGTVPVRKVTAKINIKTAKEMYAKAAPDMVPASKIKLEKREIPWKYIFLHPASIQPVGGEFAFMSMLEPKYEMVIPEKLRKAILNPTEDTKELVKSIPKEIIDAVKAGKQLIFPSDKLSVFYYKKDDWSKYAVPLCAPIIKDIILLEKMKLADSAALDGAISNIRIIKLGNLEHKIPPQPDEVTRLAEILSSNTNVGTLDLIWGPAIELIESKSTVYEFLKKEKYEPTLNSIFMGLGVPPTLTGTAGSGTTNNYISLSTLVERLSYCRNILVDFWTKELANLQRAMGFKDPFEIEFDIMDFANDGTLKQLYLQLWDRGIISDEKLQTILELSPDVEETRISSDESKRESGAKPKKLGPFNQDKELDAGVPGQGRPKNSNDKEKRKTKKFTPRSKSMLYLWTLDAQEQISEIINPIVLQKYSKKNMRSLTDAQLKEADAAKYSVLSNLEAFCKINQETVLKALEMPLNDKFHISFNDINSEFYNTYNRQPTTDELKHIKAYAYLELEPN